MSVGGGGGGGGGGGAGPATAEGAGPVKSEGKEGAKEEECESGEWVEYVDSLGRSRRCLKEDLEEMVRRDKEMATSHTNRHKNNRYVCDVL